MSASIDLESLSIEELKALSQQARKKADALQDVAKFEILREQAYEAVQNAPAERLPAVLDVLKGAAKRKALPSGGKTKSVYRWDESLQKNRQVSPDGSFVEPAILMRGRYAVTPIR